MASLPADEGTFERNSRRRARDEEREARRTERARERALAKAQRSLRRERRRRRADVIREELAKPRAKHCHCGITAGMTVDELMGLGAGCTAGRYVCPVLDAIRRRLGA